MNRAVILLPLLALACAESAPSPFSPSTAELAKGTSTTDTDPRAVWEFFGTYLDEAGLAQSTRIRGDGRDAGGAGPVDPSQYRGDVCGVHAKIFVGNGGGDAVIDPDKQYKPGSCPGGKRLLTFDLGSGSDPIHAGAFTNARGVWHLAEGESVERTMQFQYSTIPNCELLRFSGETTDSGVALSKVLVTRLPNAVDGARQWSVESISPHTAGCANWSKGAYRLNGPSYTMPFRAVVTEVR